MPARSLTASLPKLLFVAGLVAATTAMTACGPQASRDPDAVVTEAGEDSAFNVKVGDCMEQPPDGEFDSVTVVPCSDPHDSEIFFEFRLSGSTYPGDAAVEAEATEKCDQQFEVFVGLPWDDSVLNWSYIQPTKDSWEQQNDRIVQCLIFDEEGQTTGSLKGAKR